MDMDFDNILELNYNDDKLDLKNEINTEMKLEKKIGHYERDPLRVFFTKFGDPINVLEEFKDNCKVCEARISISQEAKHIRYINKNKILFNK